MFANYPVLFAIGSVKIERLLSKKPIFINILAFIMMGLTIPFIPEMTPILSIEKYTDYAKIEEKNGRFELTGDYADMFGWEEQVQLVDSVYNSLSEKEQQNSVLWAENYGEAGALKILGKKYDLPNPISRHGSFWGWGYGNKDASVWISLGNARESVMHVFEDVRLIKIIIHKYAIGEEVNIPVYVCRKPKVDINQWWLDYRPYVYD